MRRKPLSILFAALAAVAVAVRCVLYFTAIDPATGFYTDSFQTFGSIVSIGFLIALIACLAAFRLVKEPAAGDLGRAPGLAVISFAMAGALCFDTVVSLQQGINTINCAVGLLALLSAAYFVFVGIDRLKETARIPALLYIFPSVWSAVKLVIYYTRFHGVVDISEGVLEVFALGLSMMFWLYHTRMMTGRRPARAAQWGYGFGIAAAAACCMVTLPRLAAGLIGRRDLAAHGTGLQLALLVSVVYIAFFLVRYHIASADSPLAPDAELEKETNFELKKEPDPEEPIAVQEWTSAVEDMSAEPLPVEPAPSAVDDRIDRLVDELLRQKQEKNEQDTE